MLPNVLSYFRIGGLSLLVATLTACGGGGSAGGGFINAPIGGDSSATSYSLSIETLNPAGENGQVTSEAPLTVNVTLTASDDSTPTNELITLSTAISLRLIRPMALPLPTIRVLQHLPYPLMALRVREASRPPTPSMAVRLALRSMSNRFW